MELSDIRDNVRILAGIPSNDARVPDDVLTLMVNSAIRRIDQVHDWPWLYVVDGTNTETVVGQIEYPCEVGFRRTLSVTLGGDRNLDARTPRDVHSLSTVNDYPRFYTVERNTLQLVPAPTDVETIEHVYLGSDDTLVADAAAPLLPDPYIDMVLWGTAYMVHARLKDTQAFRGAYAEYMGRVKEAADDTRQFTGGIRPKHREDWTA